MGTVNTLRGVTSDQSINTATLVKDTRPLTVKIIDGIKSPGAIVITLFMCAVACFIFKSIADYLFIFGFFLFLWGLRRKEWAMIKIPIQEDIVDANEIHPGTRKPTIGQGIFFLGNDIRLGKEVWLTNSDCRQHVLALGTTGAGKTEMLLGFAANALSWGSGFLFCDGKGDVSLFAKIYAMARRFGREDDLLVLNFMTGNEDVAAAGGQIKSNTLNPYATGSSDGLAQMTTGLMDETGGDGGMWKGRAIAMLTGIMRALCWMRDNGYVDLNVGVIREYMALSNIIKLGSGLYPDMPQQIVTSINSYLTSLPGFNASKGEAQAQTTLDQHGYLEMQFTKILGSLADVYGHIFSTPYGEVDMNDVVLGRRILVVMLPALEKSGDEIANLGKIIVAALKGMMGSTLGSRVDGSWDDVVENRVTNSPSPFEVILDEVGYYTVEGMALMAAQARSLGFMMVYASQDIPAMKRLNEKEALSIIANTNLKIFMRTEEESQTGELGVKSGGKSARIRASGFDRKTTETGIYFSETEGSTVEEVDRINFLDLKRQSEGDMHIIYKDMVVRARSFYADPASSLSKNKLALRANHFVTVEKPAKEDIERTKTLPIILKKMMDPTMAAALQEKAAAYIELIPASVDSENVNAIAIMASAFSSLEKRGRTILDVSVASVASAIDRFDKGIYKVRSHAATMRDRGRMSDDGDDYDVPDTYYNPNDYSERSRRAGLSASNCPDLSRENWRRPDRDPRNQMPPTLPRDLYPPRRSEDDDIDIQDYNRKRQEIRENNPSSSDIVMKALSSLDGAENVGADAVSTSIERAIGAITPPIDDFDDDFCMLDLEGDIQQSDDSTTRKNQAQPSADDSMVIDFLSMLQGGEDDVNENNNTEEEDDD